MTKIMSITAKCSDQFAASLYDNSQSKPIGKEYVGYVPDFMPGDHYGDYVELDIDVATGKIVNWRKPSESTLKTVFGYK